MNVIIKYGKSLAIIAFSTLLLSSILFGCSSSQETKTLTLSQAKSLNGYFILHEDDTLEPLPVSNCSKSSTNLNTDGVYEEPKVEYGFSYRLFENIDPIKINVRNGDRLIVCGSEANGMSSNTGFLTTYVGYGCEKYMGKYFDYETLDGELIPQRGKAGSNAELTTFWRNKGLTNFSFVYSFDNVYQFMLSESMKSFEVSKYENASKVEETLHFDVPCALIVDSTAWQIPVDRSNDGYFIIDVSSLENGVYCESKDIKLDEYYLFSIER